MGIVNDFTENFIRYKYSASFSMEIKYVTHSIGPK